MEVELETTGLNCRENMQQAVLTEKERFTQMQWDMEELRRKCLETEMKLKFEEVWLCLLNLIKHFIIPFWWPIVKNYNDLG